MIILKPHTEGVILSVKARAGARVTGVQTGPSGTLKVSVTQAPEKGKANQAIAGLLSKILDVPKSQIELVAGKASSQKRFLIRGTSQDELQAAIQNALGQ